MANVTLWGASYPDVPAIEVPKTGGGTAAFTDVTDTTAAAADVASGKYFYSAAGVRTQGTSTGGVTYSTMSVSLPVNGWSSSTQTVSASIVTATNDVIVAPQPSDTTAWAAAGVVCTAQGSGTLTFTCTITPPAALTANVMAFEGGTQTTTVTLSMTNTVSPSDFQRCDIVEYSNGSVGSDIATLSDPAGSVTFSIDPTLDGFAASFASNWGVSYTNNNIACTGGVSWSHQTAAGDLVFLVTGSGTVTLNSFDFGD